MIYFPSEIKSDTTQVPQKKNEIEFLSLNQLKERGMKANLDSNLLNIRPEKKDTAVIMYTSGSTGIPKG